MTVESSGQPPAESYGTPPLRESGRPQSRAAGEIPATEIWLRGNPRPVIGLCVAGLAVTAALAAGGAAAGGPPWLAAVIGLAAAAGIAVLGAGALQPRLARRGRALLVRLQPLVAWEVPLAVVECVFPGSRPLPPSGHPPDHRAGGRRVETIVIRLAERATEWRQRPTCSPWGSWTEGQIVIDGRWCEPLSPDFTRMLAGRLVEAKREAGLVRPGERPTGSCSETPAGPAA